MRRRTFIRRHRALLQEMERAIAALQAGKDAEALHSLRVAARRLRALHQPLAGRRRNARYGKAARTFLDATSPLRDGEVLALDLGAHAVRPAAARQRRQDTLLAGIMNGPELARLAALCARRASLTRRQLPDRDELDRRRRKLLSHLKARLARQLAVPEKDMHRLRLDIKKLRYLLEQGSGKERSASAALYDVLVLTQGMLGDWHDRSVWIALAQTDGSLQSELARWRRERTVSRRRLRDLFETLRIVLAPR